MNKHIVKHSPVNDSLLGALCPFKSGLMNKHIVKHIGTYLLMNKHIVKNTSD